MCAEKRICTIKVNPAAFEKDDNRYLALSYVWEKTRPAKWDGQGDVNPKPGPSITVGPRLFEIANTIADAIAVTTALGRRYLWADQYCINQDDDKEKKEQIRQMQRIYEKADAALVAAAGKDRNYGLPGVSTRARRRPKTLKVAGLTARCVNLLNPAIKSSAWATRGWTYEEAFLSRRRIVFLDEQAYFECKEGHACEFFSLPGDQYITRFTVFGPGADPRRLKYTLEAPAFRANIGHTISLTNFSGAIFYAHSVIGEYKKRTLTKPSDSLNAFLGMMESF